MLKTIKIKSIKSIGKRVAYDLTVPETHNFVLSNGVLTHNTKISQDCLKSTMEQFSANCFFIFTANDFSKIIEPIQSRCVLVNFEKPNKASIYQRLTDICASEQIEATHKELNDLINNYYPDIRSMVKTLQSCKIEGKRVTVGVDEYTAVLDALKSGNLTYIYNKTYSNDLDLFGFNRWLFRYFYNNYSMYKNIGEIALCCAEIEKGHVIGANMPIIFLSNMTKIMKLMQ